MEGQVVGVKGYPQIHGPPDSIWVCGDHPRMATLRDHLNIVFTDDQLSYSGCTGIIRGWPPYVTPPPKQSIHG